MAKAIASLPAMAVVFILAGTFFLSPIIPAFLTPITLIPYLLWMYSLGVVSSRTLSVEIHLPIGRFKAALLYASIYAIILYIYGFAIMPYAFPFHLIAVYCAAYSMYFVAKSMRSVELGREAGFEEYFAVLFGLYFFPIGAWFIQRKIKNIVINNETLLA